MQLEQLYDLPGHLIRRANQISGAAFSDNVAGIDLTSVQYAALVAISSRGDLDATRLSTLIAFDRATIGGVIDRLEAKGLVARRPSAEDRRVKLLSITAAGKALLVRIEKAVLQTQADLMAPLDAKESEQLIRLLKKLVRSSVG